MSHRVAWRRSFLAGPLCCVVAMTEGCGLVLTHGPPIGHEQMYSFDCTESRALPILDFVGAGLLLALTIDDATSGEGSPFSDGFDAYVTLSGALRAGFLTASGVIGLKRTSRCREAQRLLADRLAAQAMADSARPVLADSIPSAVHVDPAESSIPVGEQVQLTATAVNSSGVSLPGRSFVWTSSDYGVASVDAEGLVTARGEGRAMIAANAGGVVGIAEVVVTRRAHLASPGRGR